MPSAWGAARGLLGLLGAVPVHVARGLLPVLFGTGLVVAAFVEAAWGDTIPCALRVIDIPGEKGETW